MTSSLGKRVWWPDTESLTTIKTLDRDPEEWRVIMEWKAEYKEMYRKRRSIEKERENYTN